MVLRKEFFENANKINSADNQKSTQNYPACKELRYQITLGIVCETSHEISCHLFKDVTEFVVCCSCDWHLKGQSLVELVGAIFVYVFHSFVYVLIYPVPHPGVGTEICTCYQTNNKIVICILVFACFHQILDNYVLVFIRSLTTTTL